MRQILTDVACKTKPPRNGRLEIADLRQVGLVLRITSNGARSFAYRFRHPHTRKTLRATIGPYPAVTLESARRRAKEMAAQVADGTNPIEARNVEREAAPARTFEALPRDISESMPHATSGHVLQRKTGAILPFTSYQSGASAISGQFDAQIPSNSSKALSAAASTLPAIACMRSSQEFFRLRLIAT